MNIIKDLLKNGIVLLLFIVQLLPALSQNRGDFSFGSAHATHAIMSGLSGGTAAGGGGIMFEKAAVLSQNIEINSLEIAYNSSNIDGQKLELQINGANVNYEICDWMLIPLAKYANHDYTLCFTYFGNLIDETLQNTILDNNGHILNYHPELANTLLGWRLADMDLLVLYDFTTDLPKIEGEYVLGTGEQIPNVNANKLGSSDYLNYLYSIENELGQVFRSYIITDHFSDTELNIKNDSLTLSGDPYYYCWQLRKDAPGFDIDKVADSIKVHYENRLNQELQNDPGFDENRLYIDSLISLSIKYATWYPIYESGPIIELNTIETYDEKWNYLNNYYTEDLKNYVIEVATYMHAFEVIHLQEYSDRMSAVPEMISACNPAVWNATVQTMRVSAFFRFIKDEFPDQWQTFVNQISVYSPSPKVITPTVIYDKGNSIIDQALANSSSVFSQEINSHKNILVYPNPVKTNLTIENLTGKNSVQIISADGKTNIIEIVNDFSKQVPMQHFANGNYILNVIKENKVIHSEKIIKK